MANSNVTHQTKHEQANASDPRAPQIQCWHAREGAGCVIYAFRLASACDRFMQHNIELNGHGGHNNKSAYGVRACTGVANFIPSTVSLQVVKDPCHMHSTNKSARTYAQHSTMRRHTKLRKHDWETMLLDHVFGICAGRMHSAHGV